MAKNETQELQKNGGLMAGLSFAPPVAPQPVADEEGRGGETHETPAVTPRESSQEPATPKKGTNPPKTKKTPQTAPKAAEAPKKSETPQTVPDDEADDGEALPVARVVEAGYRQQFAAKRARETLTHRTTISLAPSLKAKVDEAVERGEIKSLNDLVNYLLRQYFGC